jgi:hypothetical protein
MVHSLNTAFPSEYKKDIPRERLECSCRQISNMSQKPCGLGIWVLLAEIAPLETNFGTQRSYLANRDKAGPRSLRSRLSFSL